MATAINVLDIKNFEVTGVQHRIPKRFKITTESFSYAMGINLWRGTVWAVLHSGNRKRIKTVNY